MACHVLILAWRLRGYMTCLLFVCLTPLLDIWLMLFCRLFAWRLRGYMACVVLSSVRLMPLLAIRLVCCVLSPNASKAIWHPFNYSCLMPPWLGSICHLFSPKPLWLYDICCLFPAWRLWGYMACLVLFLSNTYRAIQFFVCFRVTPWGLGDICCVCSCLMLLSLLACLKKHLIEASANAFLIETSVQSQSSLCV